MIVENDVPDTLQCAFSGGDLRKYIAAIAVIVKHFLDTVKLPYHPVYAVSELLGSLLASGSAFVMTATIIIHSIPPWGIFILLLYTLSGYLSSSFLKKQKKHTLRNQAYAFFIIYS